MPVRPVSNSNPKAVYSVSETARSCELSRARFYELVKAGVMPQPCYDLVTKKPLYLAEIHEQAVQVRRSNIGIDGRYVLFYTRRTEMPVQANPTRRSQRQSAPTVGRLREIVDGLRSLGVTATENQIAALVSSSFPAGIPDEGFDTALRTLFRLLRRQVAA